MKANVPGGENTVRHEGVDLNEVPVLWVPKRCWGGLLDATPASHSEVWVGRERRVGDRESMDQAGLLQLEVGDISQAVFVQCENVSSQGLGLLSPVAMPVGGRIRFALRGQGNGCIAAFVLGQVAWCQPQASGMDTSMYRIGVRLAHSLNLPGGRELDLASA